MKSILRCLALLFALSSCEQVIEPDLPEHTPRLVLHAFFIADGIWTAYVGRSSGILESRSLHERSVADAAVELLAGDRVIEEMKFLEAARVYVFEDSTLEAGETYSLQVSAPGFATIRATDAIPKPVPTSILSYRTNTSVRSRSEISGEFSIELEILELEIQDPPGEANYYQISMYQVSTGRGAWRYEGILSTKDPSIMADNGVDESPLEEESFSGEAPYFKDTLFDGRTHAIELTYGGVSVLREDIVRRAEVAEDDQGPSNLKTYLQVLYISAAYYEYLKTARLHDYTRDNPFAEPLSVYSNVESGYGIFAGYSSQTFELVLE